MQPACSAAALVISHASTKGKRALVGVIIPNTQCGTNSACPRISAAEYSFSAGMLVASRDIDAAWADEWDVGSNIDICAFLLGNALVVWAVKDDIGAGALGVIPGMRHASAFEQFASLLFGRSPFCEDNSI